MWHAPGLYPANVDEACCQVVCAQCLCFSPGLPVVPEEKRMWAVSLLPATWACAAAGGGALSRNCCQLTSPGRRST
jgi:hypothetical protein